MPLLSTHDSMLLVIDMQTGLLPAIDGSTALVDRAGRLANAAQLLGVPVMATEHWAGKIGPTDPGLLPFVDHVIPKEFFDATREPGFREQLPPKRTRVLLIGTEAHVCVLQTGLGLAALGLSPVLVTDCVGSRARSNLQAACERWRHHGYETMTAEMAMFEWLESPRHPNFKAVLNLLKSDAKAADTKVVSSNNSTEPALPLPDEIG